MSVRSFAVFVVLALLSPSLAFAIENGKAQGTITINRKPVKMKYAFARKEKDSDEKDRWVVVVTDRGISRSVLADDSRFDKAVENGAVVAAVFGFDEGKQLDRVEVRSKALQRRTLTMNVGQVTLKGPTFASDAIEAGAKVAEDQTSSSDVAVLDVTFRGVLGKDGKFGENHAAAKELAASAPKLTDGAAKGTLTIDGSIVKLAHSAARTRPSPFDKTQTEWVVLLTNEPVAAEVFADQSQLLNAARDGAVQGLLLRVEADEKPYHLQLLHPKHSLQVSGSGFWSLDVTDFSDKHVAGRFYTTEDRKLGEHKYSYDVSFATAVEAIPAPQETTIDASSGTKLPSNGGEPGKAYMAFDKATRGGDLATMKKYASKTRPLPEMNAEEAKEFLELIKAFRPAKIKVKGGFANGGHATLNVEADHPSDKIKKGTIEMALEDGTWKVLKEVWQ